MAHKPKIELELELSPRVSDFQPGDVVRLISGGPRMSVEMVSAECAFVVWFDDNNTLRRERLPKNSLTRA